MPDMKTIDEVMNRKLSHIVDARAQQKVVHQVVGEAEFVCAVVKFDGSVDAPGRCLHDPPRGGECRWAYCFLMQSRPNCEQKGEMTGQGSSGA
jgi:hypothetical protein